MEHKVFDERELKSQNGFAMLLVIVFGFILSTAAFVLGIIDLEAERMLPGGLLFGGSMVAYTLFGVLCAGLKIVRPNEARIFTLFGTYYGTIKTAGYFYVNPFCVSFSPAYNAAVAEAKQKTKMSLAQDKMAISLPSGTKAISLKKQTLDNNRQKVNDVLGNPIIIGVIAIWHVENPTQAVFSVENYQEYLSIQTDSIIRNVAR
ncbi:MAG: SPFH domain-containing protein, partial [Oscillospiraceae bacterium]|nr:SPFH domain-containing protein [Oscillospiraceae bacterium]